MNIYTYHDNIENDGPIMFQCEANSIGEADKLFYEQFGFKPEKNAYIGCSLGLPTALEIEPYFEVVVPEVVVFLW